MLVSVVIFGRFGGSDDVGFAVGISSDIRTLW